MSERLKVVHYLNQYFAGVGGEEEANAAVKSKGPSVRGACCSRFWAMPPKS